MRALRDYLVCHHRIVYITRIPHSPRTSAVRQQLSSFRVFFYGYFWQLGLILIGLALGALLEPGPVANEGEKMHDLERAEIILKII